MERTISERRLLSETTSYDHDLSAQVLLSQQQGHGQGHDQGHAQVGGNLQGHNGRHQVTSISAGLPPPPDPSTLNPPSYPSGQSHGHHSPNPPANPHYQQLDPASMSAHSAHTPTGHLSAHHGAHAFDGSAHASATGYASAHAGPPQSSVRAGFNLVRGGSKKLYQRALNRAGSLGAGASTNVSAGAVGGAGASGGVPGRPGSVSGIDFTAIARKRKRSMKDKDALGEIGGCREQRVLQNLLPFHYRTIW